MASDEKSREQHQQQQEARILQLECIVQAKERELDLVRRDYASGGPSQQQGDDRAHDAAAAAAAADALRAAEAENAALRRRVAELEGARVMASAAAAGVGSTTTTISTTAVMTRAIALSRELTQLLLSGSSEAAAAAAPPAAIPQVQPFPAAPPPSGQQSSQRDADTEQRPLPAWLSLSMASESGQKGPTCDDGPESNGGAKKGSEKKTLMAITATSVISLSISGVKMDALAAALTRVVPESRLARMFRETGAEAQAAEATEKAVQSSTEAQAEPAGAKGPDVPRLPRDSQGRIFLPYPPDCFAAVLDLLHGLTWWPRGNGGIDASSAGPSAPSASATATGTGCVPPPPPPPPHWWWRDRVLPSREPILRELMLDLGLESLLGVRAGAGSSGGLLGVAAAVGGGVADEQRGGPLAPGRDPRSAGNMYERLAALARAS
jgi:hypothetical protein